MQMCHETDPAQARVTRASRKASSVLRRVADSSRQQEKAPGKGSFYVQIVHMADSLESGFNTVHYSLAQGVWAPLHRVPSGRLER